MTLRIGILGAAGIAPKAIIDPASRRDDVEIVAVAARSADAAAAYAKKHGIPRSFGGYAELIADPDVDLVYVALPPSGHAEWSIRAMEGGKDVLCEKPSAMNAAETATMSETAERTGRRFIEAFHDRYHPLTADILDVLASGRLGRLTDIDSQFAAHIPFDPASIRHDPSVGGGALMDLGCYAAHWLRTFGGSEPTVVSATATRNALGADQSMEARVRFESGATGRLFSSMDDGELRAGVTLTGERGTIRVENLVFPSSGHTIVETIDGISRTRTVAGADTYDHQLAAVVSALATGESLPTEGADAIANMTLIDSIYTAAGFTRGEARS